MAPKLNTSTPNRWKEYHEYLMTHKNDEWKDTLKHICERLGISDRTYYRKIEKPESLSPAEKEAVAAVYQMPLHFIFPELEPEAV